MLLYSRCIHLRRALHCKLLPTLIVSIILCASTSKYAMRTKPLGCSEEAKGRSPCKRLLYTNYIIITTLLLLFSWYWWGCWGHDADCNKTLELAEGKLSASHYLVCSVKPAEWTREWEEDRRRRLLFGEQTNPARTIAEEQEDEVGYNNVIVSLDGELSS